ncbi:expressed unknown protein [Seminavis robusta]|uniref:Uncharacterized protein n=1 Tax=Seminavis robusta TaxID=568900 RepID=A0A9N8H6K2_9STRA|nr:expressed unknown protein [Seminavis robusta]|eukprot:Sro102_g052100.1 n/a (430) ;mRNA; f:63952-65241
MSTNKKVVVVLRVLLAISVLTILSTFRSASLCPTTIICTRQERPAAVDCRRRHSHESFTWIPTAANSQSCMELLSPTGRLPCLANPSNFEGYWTQEVSTLDQTLGAEPSLTSWSWHFDRHDDRASSSSGRNPIRVPNIPPFATPHNNNKPLGSLSLLQETNNASLVLYGSSHVRELYFAMIRMARGQKYDAPLETNVMRVGSAPFGYNATPACGDSPNTMDKRHGIDLEACGEPDKRLVPELGGNNNNVAIGFKTFLHTPQADDSFLDFLQANRLRHPSVLVVDVGIWGLRGRKTSPQLNNRTHGVLLQPDEEVDYYLHWLENSFPNSTIIYVYEKGPLVDLESWILPRIYDIVHQQQQEKNRGRRPLSMIVRKDLIQNNRPEDMPCAHGCAGPVTMVVSSLILDWLSEVFLPGHDDCDVGGNAPSRWR